MKTPRRFVKYLNSACGLKQHSSVIKKTKLFGTVIFSALVLSACATPAGDAKDVKNKTTLKPGFNHEQESSTQGTQSISQENGHSALSSSVFANVRSAIDGAQINEVSGKVSSALTQTAINKTEDLINQKANEIVNSVGRGKTEFSLRQLETKNPDFSIKTIQPLSDLTDESTQVTFTQAQVSSGENHGERRATINLGIGQRYLLEDGQSIAGINLFTDYETESKHSRASLGLEYQRANFSANVNQYVPLSKKVVIGDYTEEPLAGYDVRLTGQVPYLPWAKIKGTQYYWDAIAGENIKGTRVGVEAEINAATTLEIGTEQSNTASRTGYARLTVQLPYNANPASSPLIISDKAFENSDKLSLTDLNFVERSNKIRIEKLLNGVSVVLGAYSAPTSGAACTLYNPAGVAIANGSGVTGTDGSVTLSNVVLPTGLIYSVCTGGNYIDEATGINTPAPSIRAATIYTGSGNLMLVSSPLSEIAYQLASADLVGTITAKNTEVATAFGMGSVDIITTIPTDINTTQAGDDDMGKFGTMLAVISQMGENAGDATPVAAIDALVDDMLGTDGSYIGTIEGRDSVDITAAINNFENGFGDDNGPGASHLSPNNGEGTIKSNAAIAFIGAYNGTSAAPTLQHYIDAGVTGVISDNLVAVNAAVSGQEAGTTAQIQALADASIAKASSAIARISGYAGTGTAPTLQQYIDAGVTGVTAGSLTEVNTKIAGAANEDSDTTAKIQSIVDSGVTNSSTTITLGEATSGTYTVVLDTQPTGNVTITPSSNNTAAATVSKAMTFTTANWNIPQTVTVTGVADDDATNESVTITQAVKGADYKEVTSANVTVTVMDDDEIGLTFSQSAFTVNEPSIFAPHLFRSFIFTVKLNTQPTGNTIMVATSADPNTVYVNETRGFTPENWNIPQTVTVTGLADADATNESVAISFKFNDADYQGKTFADVTTTVIDSTVIIGTQTWAKHNSALTPSFMPSEGTNYWTTMSGEATDYGYYYLYWQSLSACPSGWHVPSDAEFMVLEGYLGMSVEDQNKINIPRGTDQATQLNVGGDTGFEAMPAGIYWYRTYNNIGYELTSSGNVTYFVTSTRSADNNNNYVRSWTADGGRIGRTLSPTTGIHARGYSVRCLKN